MKESGQFNEIKENDLFHDNFSQDNKTNLSISIIEEINPFFCKNYNLDSLTKNKDDFFYDEYNLKDEEETEISEIILILNQSINLNKEEANNTNNRESDEILEILKKQPKTAKSSLNVQYTSFKNSKSSKINKISMSGKILSYNKYNNSSSAPQRCSHPAFKFNDFKANENIFNLAKSTPLNNDDSMK